MSNKIILKNGTDSSGNAIELLIENERIAKIEPTIANSGNVDEVNLEGKTILPGLIDDQVHFREPGLTHKANIASESAAAALGGVTSFFEMPNTNPQTTTVEALNQKYEIAKNTSTTNYSFFFGATNENLEEVKKITRQDACGLKIFMGSSTGNMLVDEMDVLSELFSTYPHVIATHCEDESTIRAALAKQPEEIPPEMHPVIRSSDACYLSSKKAVALARETGAKLHVLHISTAKELELFDTNLAIEQKQITAEACLHHLFFSDADYLERGNLIKWNPAVKREQDRAAIQNAILDGTIDIVATDHAPHTKEEKALPYRKCPSGGPSVQFFIPLLLSIGVPLVEVERLSAHNPAIRFGVKERGFLKEGYFADITVIDPNSTTVVEDKNVKSICGWSPFFGKALKGSVTDTFVNGVQVVKNCELTGAKAAHRIKFND